MEHYSEFWRTGNVTFLQRKMQKYAMSLMTQHIAVSFRTVQLVARVLLVFTIDSESTDHEIGSQALPVDFWYLLDLVQGEHTRRSEQQ